MLYLVEKAFERQLAALQALAQLAGRSVIVAWLYDGASRKAVAGGRRA